MTPIQTLYDRAARNQNDTAFIAAGDKWTYERFSREVRRVARGLAARGVQKGDRIALHLPNCPELAVTVYACFHLGAIAVPLNNRYKGAELKAMLQRSEPTLYVGHAELYREVRALSSSIIPPQRCFITCCQGDDGEERRWAELQMDLFWDIPFSIPVSSDIDAPTLLLATSGTTGIPKFVIHTLSTLAATAEDTKYVGVDGSLAAIIACPMVHAGGLFSFIGCMHHGAQMVLFERFDADAVLDAIEQHGCGWMLGLTFMWTVMLEAQRLRRRNVETLRFCASAGDVCRPQLQLEFDVEFGLPLYSIWGASEAVGCLTFGLPPGPISRVAQGAHVRLVDNAGATVSRGEVGELLLRGANVSVGYWNGPGAIESAPKDGWYQTGDLMRQDDKGNLWFMGRKKDIIIRGGSNISPVEVEAVLTSHPEVQDAAIVGIPDDTFGQRVVGFVQLDCDARSGIENDILDAARTQLADYKMPERLQVVSSIPRNGLGKTDRRALLALAIDAGAGQGGALAAE
ncbi:class I adenylate-forming enzyme family protein [Mesorhizobium sp. B2-4-13]|uniref:class I adenylate-forming enzyme family protein n=1 Tax=Mesorhizobium sp. B2-4-13 TaxID=2589936 RepID=UPI0015EEC891|nr:class I adenylate-forming enzyme family protein [Mesorhizobium sp. B2-4-13]